MTDLEERVRLLVESAVADATATIVDQVVEQLAELVPELVRERLLNVIDGVAVGQRDLKPAKMPKPARAKKSPTPRAAVKGKGKGVPTCGECGETGHNKRTCGKRESSKDDAEEE